MLHRVYFLLIGIRYPDPCQTSRKAFRSKKNAARQSLLSGGKSFSKIGSYLFKYLSNL